MSSFYTGLFCYRLRANADREHICSSLHFQYFLQIAQCLACFKYSTNAYCLGRKLKILKYKTMLKLISVLLDVHTMFCERSKEEVNNYIRLDEVALARALNGREGFG